MRFVGESLMILAMLIAMAWLFEIRNPWTYATCVGAAIWSNMLLHAIDRKFSEG